ncbi:PREDICTED: probable inactive serine/threonine-protein kinase fnkC isoform X1 [Camelina sativa]|uniref:Probable inactive serine/threonine-protein kinase fnkC isoform X1 n=1 Tax=Camelina sativa TaxID=90675 RepID=A0ABM0Z8R2_CAMSA|nr:PREDICTED: probable inactive serine/threonine-protein kinase fnkC isoform X1 [Camelina sativa]
MGATISAPVPTIKQKWRDHPPSSYSLKIQNFSQLENSTASSDHKYQSRFFSSGGHKWRLIVYPKGNVKDNGSGFISMYVEVDSTSLVSTPPTEVFAKLRFFVYNKKINKYFTIQDVEVKRFNALKLVWGLLKVLPYETFIHPENGYIFEGGQCEFGIDVIVPPPLTNWEIVSFDEKLLSYPKFSWTVKNFSELREEIYTSNSFPMGGRKWVLKVYPKGRSRADGKYLSVFLYLADSEILKPDEKIFMQGIVRLRNPFGSNHLAHQISCWHEEKKNGWGWDNFVRLAELKQTYLDKEDTLKFETEFKVVSEAKYSPINT